MYLIAFYRSGDRFTLTNRDFRFLIRLIISVGLRLEDLGGGNRTDGVFVLSRGYFIGDLGFRSLLPLPCIPVRSPLVLFPCVLGFTRGVRGLGVPYSDPALELAGEGFPEP